MEMTFIVLREMMKHVSYIFVCRQNELVKLKSFKKYKFSPGVI